MKNLLISFMLSLNLFCTVNAFEFLSTFNDPIITGNQLHLEPIYSNTKYKSGEKKQKGSLYGIKGSYDFLVYNAPYIGIEALYRSGDLKGSSLSSKYKDYIFEAKVGMTMGAPGSYSFIPYAGIGHGNEKNNYKTVPLEKIYYYYLSLGVHSQIFLAPQISVGFNAKLKLPVSGRHELKNEQIDLKLKCPNRPQYIVEIPLTYWATTQMNISAVPFYENKNYANNPTNLDWKKSASISQLGARVRFAVLF